jgi:hypothetical protein
MYQLKWNKTVTISKLNTTGWLSLNVYLTMRYGTMSCQFATLGRNKCKKRSWNLSHLLLTLEKGGGLQCIERNLTHVKLTLLRSFGMDAGNIHPSITLYCDVTWVHSDPNVMDNWWIPPHKMNGIYLSTGLATAFLQWVMVTHNSFGAWNQIVPLTSTDMGNLFTLCLVIARIPHEQT